MEMIKYHLYEKVFGLLRIDSGLHASSVSSERIYFHPNRSCAGRHAFWPELNASSGHPS
jgi:hypothetical protein